MDSDFLKEVYGGTNSKSDGMMGILARGKKIYKGGSKAAHQGGGSQYGRPKKAAIMRKLKGMK